MPDRDIAAVLLRGQRRQTVVLVVTVLVAIGFSSYAYVKETQIHHALCTFRSGVVDSRDGAQQFLRKHPRGFAGIDPATIQSTIAAQTRTIESLRSLGCR